MGMFDEIKVYRSDIPDRFWGEIAQTKGLDCCMYKYILTDEGLFWKASVFDDPQEEAQEHKTIHTGLVVFYFSDPSNNNWVDFYMLMDRGDILWVRHQDVYKQDIEQRKEAFKSLESGKDFTYL